MFRLHFNALIASAAVALGFAADACAGAPEDGSESTLEGLSHSTKTYSCFPDDPLLGGAPTVINLKTNMICDSVVPGDCVNGRRIQVATDGEETVGGRVVAYTDVFAVPQAGEQEHYRIYAPTVADSDVPHSVAHHADFPRHQTRDPFAPIAVGDEACLEVQ
jgi:hypothetical protein